MLKLLMICCFIFIKSIDSIDFDDYTDHPCKRDCSLSTGSKTCIYNFTIEWYSVLSRNCFNCKLNDTNDCLKPHCVSANGVNRGIKVVNRQLPGPSIQVCQNDLVVVNVKNNLHTFESTTIHWHGIKQHGTPHMDGVGMVTQCSIMPHTHFEYKFYAKDIGTHFWHAHSAGQRADGIYGAFIVRSSSDPNSKLYDLDQHVIVVNDWMDQSYITKYTAFLHDFGDENINGILINGRGVDVLPERNKLNFQTPRTIVNVQKGRRYRFRMINSGVQYCPLQVSIDHHNLTIISTDGNPIEPIQVTSFYILAGERVDFVLNANNNIGKYWIRIKGHADCDETEVYQTAVLKYDGSVENELPFGEVNYENSGPISTGLIFNPFNVEINAENNNKFIVINEARSSSNQTTEIKDYLNKIKLRVDKKFYLSLDMNIIKNTDVYDDSTWSEIENEEEPWASPQINNVSFQMPSQPLIFNKYPQDMYCNSQSENVQECSNDDSKFCKCLHTLDVNYGDLVEMIIADGGSQEENHPIHLHGHSFAVLDVKKLGDKVLMEDIKKMDKDGLIKRNLDNPPLKDTVTIPSGGYTIIRFIADNPGVWLLHCHVEFHSESGMALLVRVNDDKNSSKLIPNRPDNWPSCGDYYFEEKYKNNGFTILKFNLSFFISSLMIFLLSKLFI